MIAIESRNCLYCRKIIRGRIDKKFCNDYCRNSYNNRQKSSESAAPVIRHINSALLKNRRILASLLPEDGENAKTNKEKLQRLGFRFGFFTHIYITRSARTYYYCYDYGYLPLENEWYLVVKQKQE